MARDDDARERRGDDVLRRAGEPQEPRSSELGGEATPDEPSAPEVRARLRASVRRRRVRRIRRALAALTLAAPTLWIVGVDLARRADRLLALDDIHTLGYAATIVVSLVFWGAFVYAGSRREGPLNKAIAAIFVALFTIVVGVEGAFYSFYNIYLSVDPQCQLRSFLRGVFGALDLGKGFVWLHLGVALGVALTIIALARALVRPRFRRAAPLLALFVSGAMVFVPSSYRQIQASTLDVIYFDGLVAIAKEKLFRPNRTAIFMLQPRSVEDVPPMRASPAAQRNVLLILEESVRADAVCSAPTPLCERPGWLSNVAAKARMPLLQMRANDSATAISESTILSGVLPTSSAKIMHSAPYLWHYAHAAGYDTAYWTSQNVMVSGARFFTQDAPIAHRCYATNLDSTASMDYGAIDTAVTERALQEWGELKEPFFAVVHYASVHRPHYADPRLSPYKDDGGTKMPSTYRNSVYYSDMAVAELVKGVRDSPSGARTVILYTSDHGESFGESGFFGHTGSLTDIEVLVPAWIDAPRGALSPAEEGSVRGAKNELVWHLDLAPTILDLLGLWDEPALAPFRARMIGHPLTRPERTIAPVPLTNCSWVWQCFMANWGMMQGPMKLWARGSDPGTKFRCHNVLNDPSESEDLGEEACGALPGIARSLFGRAPNGITAPPMDPPSD